MKHTLLSIICGLLATANLAAESRIWTSVSGSTIEATFIGAFGEDFWFEAGEDSSFIKMPSKYISESDVALVTSGEVRGTLPESICDKEPKSVALLEKIYTTKAIVLDPETETLQSAVEQLIQPFQPKEDVEEAEQIEISFSKRKYRKSELGVTLGEGTVYVVLMQMLTPLELEFQIREGHIRIGRDLKT